MMLALAIYLGVIPALLEATASAEFKEAAVDRHNHYRGLHGVGSLTENAAISAYAQEWADYLQSIDTLQHRSPNSYGENLSKMWPDTKTGIDHTDNLYVDEAQYYLDNNYCGGEPNMTQFVKFGHYTQIVWDASTEIGIGKNGSYVVMNYNPPGNYWYQFGANVPCLE